MYLRIKGVTLIELIIVMALVSILASAVSFAFAVGLKVWSSGRSRAEIRQDGNLAMERMVRELSQASRITIADATKEKVKFSADLDQDGEIESITFNTIENNLNRTVEDIAVVLARNVETFRLTYYDLNNNLLEAPMAPAERDNIRVITITLTMNKVDETIILSSSVYVRNL